MFNIGLIIFVMILTTVGMARKGHGRRKFGRYLSGHIDHSLDLGTLAPNVLVGSDLADVVVDTTRISSIKATWAVNNMTPVSQAGPIVVGIAHSDYTDAEIEAWLEATGSWDMGNMVAKEIRSRRIRQVGIMPEASAATLSANLNDGLPVTTKLNWMLAEGDTLKVWAYNTGLAAFTSTTPKLLVNGKANLWVV